MNFTFALAQFELFVLILIRLASFVFAAPFFNMANVPNRVKIGFSFCLAIMVYSLFPDMSVEYNGMIEYAIIVVQEVIVGILFLRPDYYVLWKNNRHGYWYFNGTAL